MNTTQITPSTSKRKFPSRYLALAGLVGAFALGMAGCTIRGGGWLISLFTGEKATFAFNGTVVETQHGGVIRGQGEYHDRVHEGEGVTTLGLHLDATEEAILRCTDGIGEEEFDEFLNEFLFSFVLECLEASGYPTDFENVAVAVGEYTIQSPAFLREVLNETGCFALFVADGGQPGSGPGDFFAIALLDPDLGTVWYSNCGIVGGGNIVVQGGGF